MTSSPRCDTELTHAPPRCRATGELELKQGGGGGGLTATEQQAMAILRVARRAAAEDEEAEQEAKAAASVDCGATARLSMRRSMEWFLQRRREREARRLTLRGRGVATDDNAVAADASPSSSSFSC